jgi:two-component system alkaline phosphatase synthesis response regulator PhoP
LRRKKILVVDDDSAVVKLLVAALEKNNYEALSASSGENALELLAQTSVDAAILDVMLPGMDGLELLKRLRNHPLYNQLPILMLTCKDSEFDSVIGLELGADDYLAKPVRYHELLARLKNLFRRLEGTQALKSGKIILNNLEIDLNTRTVKTGEREIELTYLEFEILALMAKNPRIAFSRDQILEKVWNNEYLYETRTVDVHIRRLRGKLEDAGVCPDPIETIRNVGYRLTGA